jgi:uncharacterized protein (DUF305 family)
MESWLEAWYPEPESLAATIRSTQTQEIRQMSQWMDQWFDWSTIDLHLIDASRSQQYN